LIGAHHRAHHRASPRITAHHRASPRITARITARINARMTVRSTVRFRARAILCLAVRLDRRSAIADGSRDCELRRARRPVSGCAALRGVTPSHLPDLRLTS